MNKGFTEKEKIMILHICVEITMPENLCEEIEKINVPLQDIEDGLSEEIANAVSDLLPLDCELNDCYPTGWSV